MKRFIKVISSLVALALASCGGGQTSAPISSVPASSPEELASSAISENPSVAPEVSKSEQEVPVSQQTPEQSSYEDKDPRPSSFRDGGEVYEEEMHALGEFTPTRFKGDTLKIDSTKDLADGVKLKCYSFDLNSGNHVKAEVVEIDPSKAEIRSSYHPAKEVVYTQMQAYDAAHEDIKILAGLNADFFGSTCVNAYVQDGVIVKSAHNDKGIYDYTNLDADIPASLPMLFGVSGAHVRIGPIVEGKSVQETIQSSVYKKLKYAHEDKVVHQIDGEVHYDVAQATNALKGDLTLIDYAVTGGVAAAASDSYYLLEKFVDSGVNSSYQVVDEYECGAGRTMTDDTADGYAYLFKKSGVECPIEIGDTLFMSVGNDDGKWDGYTTIIGGRQSLVENGEIASTVTLENSNGAQNTGVPRSCVGITPDHKVLLTGIEGLRYGRKSTSEDDSYGVNLPELAEFERAIGCYDAMNFDGGGSTQMFARSAEEEEYDMLVRSSDYGSYTPTSCRKVFNTFLVGTKTAQN